LLKAKKKIKLNYITLSYKRVVVAVNLGLVWFMVFNTTLNNISVISWRSVLLVEETRVPRENHKPVAGH
jgi:hypothetical protein